MLITVLYNWLVSFSGEKHAQSEFIKNWAFKKKHLESTRENFRFISKTN